MSGLKTKLLTPRRALALIGMAVLVGACSSDESTAVQTADPGSTSSNMPGSAIVFLNCTSNINDCWVERENGQREYASPYRADGTSSSIAATTRFYDRNGTCFNVRVYDAPKPFAPYVRASGC